MDLDVRGLKMPGASAVNYDDHISKTVEPNPHDYREGGRTNKHQVEQPKFVEQPKVPEQPKSVEAPKKSRSIMDDDDIFNSVVNVQQPPQQPIQPVKV